MATYHLISSLSDDYYVPDQAWLARLCKQYGCLHSISSNVAANPLNVVIERAGEDIPLNFLWGPVIDIARTDFLQALGDIHDYLQLGSVQHQSGELLTNFNTIGSQYQLQLRGGIKSAREICRKCKTLLYTPDTDRYVLRAGLTGQPVYRASLGLVVNEDIHTRLRGKSWKKLRIEELRVLEQPVDGLPVHLSQVDPKDIPKRWKAPR